MILSSWTSWCIQAVSRHDLALLLTCVLGWLILGLVALVRAHSVRFVAHLLFPAGALIGLGVALLGGIALTAGHAPQIVVLPLGLPDLPFHVRLDALSGFFLLLFGVAGAGISTFAAGYFRSGEGTAPGLLCLQYHIFLASMAAVVLADDAYFFMVAWETMALSSYFLVTSQHRIPDIRRAGFLYLLMAHVGAICILLSFGVLQGGSWQFTFDAMRGASLTPFWATTAFLLALLGFGAKAGLVPMHVWLPEAHPAAPSPVSAMMSGLMLKTAIYGMLRISFDLLHVRFWQWGVLILALGLFSALFGAIFAAVQTDMKRLLAYSSIENVGLIFTGIGLSILFETCNLRLFAALALSAALIHALNHALFKSLLFLATGSVLHATKQRSLGKLGGLIRRMPWVADPGAGGHAIDCGLAATQWLCLRVAAVAVLSVHAAGPPRVHQHAGPAGGGGARFDGCFGGIRDGEVLWRDFPWSAARDSPGTRPRRQLARTPGPRLARVRLHCDRRAATACTSSGGRGDQQAAGPVRQA